MHKIMISASELMGGSASKTLEIKLANDILDKLYHELHKEIKDGEKVVDYICFEMAPKELYGDNPSDLIREETMKALEESGAVIAIEESRDRDRPLLIIKATNCIEFIKRSPDLTGAVAALIHLEISKRYYSLDPDETFESGEIWIESRNEGIEKVHEYMKEIFSGDEYRISESRHAPGFFISWEKRED